MKTMLLALTALATAIVGTSASAATTVYTSEASFRAAISGATNYSFDFGNNFANPSTQALGPVTFASPDLERYNDAYNAQYLANYYGTLSVNSTVSAVGFFMGSYDGAQTINYSFGGAMGSFTAPAPNSTAFIGFVNDAGNVMGTFSNNRDELDTVRIVTGMAAAVPEPATWALMILGMGAVGFAMRRRKNVNMTVSFA